ncbi:MAG: hypothetical protein BGP24_09875 [Lysobacterales bacterium 69-70]|nr:hypothetical protein [Xanthomonadaceae bacterium]ODU33254.1 MAG: hypothetical protein ABS97_12900 [Xanthomonadaceae bacterium SCN 69-320]ODV20420.1 MAG: hypothetical protein ABT27_06770 [Xanthomonadaceae bacterium SCN 69-25]OJZ00797.1 MAG: hypothetical protein BGP24_09875 [Xanthomonadales bacterium 69-70]
MQAIEYRYATERTMPVPAEAIARAFHDLRLMARCTSDVETFECGDDDTARWTLTTQRDLGIVFQPRYGVRYIWETPRTLSWRTMAQESDTVALDARVQFIDLSPTHSRVCISEHVQFSLPVSFITAKLVRVMAARQTLADMNGFLERMEAAVVTQTMAQPRS